ncbi:MAG: hypothetical protein PHF55_06615 [Bacteroidales bacterium]|nr:hypothetical protein [Bacteroidales bacterium]
MSTNRLLTLPFREGNNKEKGLGFSPEKSQNNSFQDDYSQNPLIPKIPVQTIRKKDVWALSLLTTIYYILTIITIKRAMGFSPEKSLMLTHSKRYRTLKIS